MSEKKITLQIDGEERIVDAGTTYMELAKEYQKNYKDDIVLVLMNNRLRELGKTVDKSGELSFITTKDNAGKKAYRRSLTFLMEKAVHTVASGCTGTENKETEGNAKGTGNIAVRVLHAIGDGVFCKIQGDFELNEKSISLIKEEMEHLVVKDLPFKKTSMNTDDAVALFKNCGMEDKERLFHYRRSSRVNVYSLNHYKDYYYGYMVPSTGYLKYFDLVLYEDGFMLMYPDSDTRRAEEFVPFPKLYSTLRESSEWGETMGIGTIGALNDAIASGRMQDIILISEALMEKKIGSLAEMIAASGNKKFIMIAGPSSSGKTTFSHRLSIQLSAKGLKPHPFPLDDYYINRDKTPRDADGKPDFECLEALDVEKFNQDLSELLTGKEVEIPVFNFKTGRREEKGKMMQLGPDDVLVIEGIHGLNDKLSYSISPEHKFKIYISALTQLNIDEHNYLPTTDGRLIRRIVRDARTRGTSARETIAMWDSVRRGEERFIFPFQEQADVMFNSALIYELAVLKLYAEPLLFAIEKDCPEYQEAKRLLKFLDYFLPVPSEAIGGNSILREFIGGGCFNL